MAEFVLEAEVRNRTGKGDAKKLRAAGRVPSVIYGKDVVPVHCSLDENTLSKTLKKANRNCIFEMKLSNGESRAVIVRDFQKHPLMHTYDHVDFQALDMECPVRVDVDVDFVGSPIGKKMGGIFNTLCRQVRIECLPGKIPASIELDITDLDAGQSYHVSDIPAGDYTVVTNQGVALCQVSKVKDEEEETEEGAESTAEAAAEKPAEAVYGK